MTNDFPHRLRKLRERKGLTQELLGEQCGLSKNVVGMYERGESVPNINVAKELANFFGVTMDYLCGNRKKS